MRLIFKHFDMRLIAIVLALSTFGCVMIASITGVNIYGYSNELKVQLLSLFLGLVFLSAFLLIDYKLLYKLYIPIYLLSIVLLLLVYIPGLGYVQNNARSWIDLRFIKFQTSELSKIGFIVFFSAYFDKVKDKINSLAYIGLTLVLASPFFILLFKQPDVGTMMVFFIIFAGLIFVSKINIKIILAVMLAVLLALPLIYMQLGDYQIKRLTSFINQDEMITEENRQVQMSKITMGSGGASGTGLYNGAFSQNNYLPVKTSDFIFPVLVEELGFVGGISVIILYFLMINRFLIISFSSRDSFGSYLSMGVLYMLASQIFENIAMTMGLMPVTGITLPFISYGGSSMLTNMIAISLVMNVYLRRHKKA